MTKIDTWMKENRMLAPANGIYQVWTSNPIGKNKVENINVCANVIVPSKVVQYLGAGLTHK